MVEIGGRRYLTPAEAALVLDVSARHVQRLLRDGSIEGWMDRRRRWALESAVRLYARSRGIPVGVVVSRGSAKGGG